ncbi:hypothetical protein G4B88_011345 [Cannabis sativa]|uniref:Bifunctional inhibitor/plant lipid transfer protein/seed storage helical domain-containing protein n=1 Tax=Cannabis sativa TaxID=3483 RepID=A0A7J6GHK9_CANSA|nr:hypothetical protein G4B88_011345 [Cannabis sativa]
MMKGMKLVGVKVVIMATIIVGCMLEGALGVCNMSEDGLNACRPAVVKNQPAPLTKKCCDALRGANLVCFCDYLNNSFLMGVLGVDRNLAMQLPARYVKAVQSQDVRLSTVRIILKVL